MPVGCSPDTARNHRPGQIILINNTTVSRQKSKQVAFTKKLTSEDNNAMLSSDRVPTILKVARGCLNIHQGKKDGSLKFRKLILGTLI